MSKSSITRSITVLFVLIISVALVSTDLIVSAQNDNSTTTQNSNDEQTRGGMMTSQNGNTSNTGGRRRSRGRRRSSTRRTTNTSGDMSNMNMSGDTSGNMNTSTDTSGNANMTGDTSGNMNMSDDTSGSTGGGRRRGRGRRRSNANMTGDTSGAMQPQTTERTDGGTQEDLAGQSYTGTVNYSEGALSGPATLSFESGNQFTLTPEGGTAVTGRYTAVTTRGYTGVTMMFSGATPPTIVSVRLRKMGRGVSIMSVPGENRQFSFTSGGGGGGSVTTGSYRRRRPRRRARRGRGSNMGAPGGGIKPPMADPGTGQDPSPSPTP